jgi:hypothetical protein
LVAATEVTALLRHRPGNPGTLRPQWILRWILPLDPRLGGAVSQNFNRWLAGLAGQLFIANIDVAIAHDGYPFFEVKHNVRLPKRVASPGVKSAATMFRFSASELRRPLLTRERLKSRAPHRIVAEVQWRGPNIQAMAAFNGPMNHLVAQ